MDHSAITQRANTSPQSPQDISALTLNHELLQDQSFRRRVDDLNQAIFELIQDRHVSAAVLPTRSRIISLFRSFAECLGPKPEDRTRARASPAGNQRVDGGKIKVEEEIRYYGNFEETGTNSKRSRGEGDQSADRRYRRQGRRDRGTRDQD